MRGTLGLLLKENIYISTRTHTSAQVWKVTLELESHGVKYGFRIEATAMSTLITANFVKLAGAPVSGYLYIL